jgi:hypothetical protein
VTLIVLLQIAARRWYVMLVVLGGTAVLTVQLLSNADGVWSTRTTVAFLYDYESTLSVDGSIRDDDVIAFAGAVAAEIVPGRQAVRYSAADAPYYGAGLREGVLVGLVDYGNQWTPSYGAAVIDIQIVGRTREWVASRQQEALQRIEHSAYVTGQPGNVLDLTPHVDPLSLRIDHIAPSRVSLVAAVAALSMAGLLAAGALAVGVDRAVAGRRSSAHHLSWRRRLSPDSSARESAPVVAEENA